MVIAQQPFCWKWISVTKISKYGQNEYSRALNASYTFQPLMGFWYYTVVGREIEDNALNAWEMCKLFPREHNPWNGWKDHGNTLISLFSFFSLTCNYCHYLNYLVPIFKLTKENSEIRAYSWLRTIFYFRIT